MIEGYREKFAYKVIQFFSEENSPGPNFPLGFMALMNGSGSPNSTAAGAHVLKGH